MKKLIIHVAPFDFSQTIHIYDTNTHMLIDVLTNYSDLPDTIIKLLKEDKDITQLDLYGIKATNRHLAKIIREKEDFSKYDIKVKINIY